MTPIDHTLVERIRAGKGLPILGVVGATVPTRPYHQRMGQEVGYALREYTSNVAGSIFTGGVEGVGIDVYVGVIQYCIEKAKTSGTLEEDHFFVLVPTHLETVLPITSSLHLRRKVVRFPTSYEPPAEYRVLGNLTPNGALRVVRAGENMEERRKYVGLVADALVVVNGGGGTLDEVIQAMQLGKRIVTIPASGGTAAILGTMKKNTEDMELRQVFARMHLSERDINRDLIHVVTDTRMLLPYLRKIL